LSKYSVAVVATGSACAAELATTEHAGVALPVSWGVVLADGAATVSSGTDSTGTVAALRNS